MKKFQSLILASGAVLLLGGCMGDAMREAMGIQQEGPDEFAVYRRAPLEMPPDFDLQQPQPGMDRPQEIQPRDLAEHSLTGGKSVRGQGGNVSQGEAGFLAEANATNADSSIRQQVNRETKELSDESQTLVDSVLNSGEAPQPYGATVDAKAEAKRLNQNKAEGKAVNEGTPVILKHRRKGLFEGWFN